MPSLHRMNSQSESSAARSLKEFALEVLLGAIYAGLAYLAVGAASRSLYGIASDGTNDAKQNAAAAKKKLNNQLVDVKFNQYEDIIAGDIVFPDEIDVMFADIGGHDKDKKEIFDLIALPLKKPEIFSKLSGSELLTPPKGVLLYGPPGTGKTMMAKAIAKESGAAFINLKMSTTMNAYFGESQKLVRAAFSLARKLAPSIIFIDEIDSFLHERRSDDSSALGNMKAEFMSLWDGIDSGPTGFFGIMVIGATNRPWDVDPAILRRMPRTFEMGLPNEKERENVLRLILRSESLDPQLEASLGELSRACVGYSGSDLKELCRAAVTIPYREYVEAAGKDDKSILIGLRPLSWNDFETAKCNVRPSGEQAGQYQEKMMQRGGISFDGGGGWHTPRTENGSSHDLSQDESFLAGVQYGLSLATSRPPPQQHHPIKKEDTGDLLD
jgi:SpoVK/Ycf46/Vps4 family AAA+-type ATPase